MAKRAKPPPADDPYTRLQPVAARGQLLRELAARAPPTAADPRHAAPPSPRREVPETEALLEVASKQLLLARRYSDALACADRWVTRMPSIAAAHYIRGRCLIGLGRLDDARASFDRACALQPTMQEAQLLRREMDRCIHRLRRTVGQQPVIELDVPDHLTAIRAPLAAGQIEAAIEILRRHEDPAAGLLLASCLTFAGRWNETLEIYDRVAKQAPALRRVALVGYGRALVALERKREAFTLLDQLCAEDPDDEDAHEARSLAC